MSDHKIDPYVPPASAPLEEKPAPAPADTVEAPVVIHGRPCENCGSTNTGAETALRTRPSIIAFVVFGWLFLLIRAAFKPATETCRDCGTTASFRTPGNNLALVVLIVIVVLLAISVLSEMQGTAH